MRIAGAVLRHGAAIWLAVALLALGGVWALFTLPAGIYPEVTYPRIVVLARGGTFEADEMTVAVTRPLEQALSGVLGLRRMRARTVRGATELSLDFRPRADMEFALSQVQGRLASTQPRRMLPAVIGLLRYTIHGSHTY